MWSSNSVVPSLCLLLIICSAVEVIGIIGGRYARLGMFPHHVSLHAYNTYIAGGSLVSATFVLTCAHCIIHDLNIYTIRAGTIDLKDTGFQTLLPKEFIRHPKHDPETFDYDIGLIRLTKPAILNDNVQIIPMAPSDAIYVKDTLAITMGYGDIDPIKTRQDCLKYVYIHIWGPELCNDDHFMSITKHGMICAGEDDGRDDPCDGDSGGGLVVNQVVMGVFFMNYGCGLEHFPTVYEFVPYHRQWIDEVMNSQYVRKKKNYWNNTMNAHNVRHKNCNHFNSTQNP